MHSNLPARLVSITCAGSLHLNDEKSLDIVSVDVCVVRGMTGIVNTKVKSWCVLYVHMRNIIIIRAYNYYISGNETKDAS